MTTPSAAYISVSATNPANITITPGGAPGPAGPAGNPLTPVAVQTADYTASAGNFVPVNASSGSVTVTLPVTPSDKSQIAVKLVEVSGSNTVTVDAGGSASFDSGGTTSVTLSLVNQGLAVQYDTALNVWHTLVDDLPLTGLDSRYVKLSGATMTGWLAPAVVTLTDGTSIAVDASKGNVFAVTLTASGHTLANPANPVDGMKITVRVIQPASGGPYTISYGTAYDFGALGEPTLSTAASAVDLIGFEYIGSLSKWRYLGAALA